MAGWAARAKAGIGRGPTSRPTTATGTLTQTAPRHVRLSVKKPPRSGPSTVVTPNTAPSAPWYLPRSRRGMMSPITAVGGTTSPPAPNPRTAPQAVNPDLLLGEPEAARAMTNTPAEDSENNLRPD